MAYKMSGFSGFGNSPTKMKGDETHQKLYGKGHKDSDHPDYESDIKQDKENPDVVETEGTTEQQKLRMKESKKKYINP